jgi:RNA polymerase sigma-70 factor (ECF subfamily)
MNPTEFKNTVLPLQDKLYRLALRLLGNREEAEDLLQEALLKLWQQGTRLKEFDSLEAWSVRLTKNLCIDRIRSRRKQHTEWKPEFDQADDSPIADRSLESKESMGMVLKCLQSLPLAQKQVVQLRDVEGMSYQEICESLEMPMPQVKINLFRGRQSLKECLQKMNLVPLKKQ